MGMAGHLPVCESYRSFRLFNRRKKEGLLMILVNNLHKQFKTFHALKGINLQVKKGEIYGFIGQNGAGKSTTMNILAGLSRPTDGECIINGKDVKKILHPSELSIGYLAEDPKFYAWMSAYETLDYLGNGYAQTVSKARIEEMLEWVGLARQCTPSRRRIFKRHEAAARYWCCSDSRP
jgi:ABC-type multidrug transport system ATPase subunit